MHKPNLNIDDSSVDFDFFESEVGKLKTYCQNENRDSSKIVTKAIIEAKPKNISIVNDFNFISRKKSTAPMNENITPSSAIYVSSSSPTSSEENRQLESSVENITLFNCLAFNNDSSDRQTDDKYYSDNSLSDSTITTVTSDLTSVSRLSSLSDSSCGSDLSSDSSVPEADELTKDKVINCKGNFNIEPYERSLSMSDMDQRNNSKGSTPYKSRPNSAHNVIPKAVELTESIDRDNEIYKAQNDSKFQQASNVDLDSTGNNSGSVNTSSDNVRGNLDEIETKNENDEVSQYSIGSVSRRESISTIEERMGGISLASQSSTNSSMAKPHFCRGQNKFRLKKRDLNLTFSREELIRIERDNTILLKKIMSYSKPRTVSLNHTFSHKKTSAAINRARQQKKIEQDNYILYSKINAMSRMKKVF